MLGPAASSSSAGPARTPSCPATGAQPGVPGDPGSLPRLRDMDAAFPFADSTSSKAEHVFQRHTHTDTHRHTHRGC